MVDAISGFLNLFPNVESLEGSQRRLRWIITQVRQIIKSDITGLNANLVDDCLEFINSVIGSLDNLLTPIKDQVMDEMISLFGDGLGNEMVTYIEKLLDKRKFDKVISFLQGLQNDAVAFVKNYEKEANEK